MHKLDPFYGHTRSLVCGGAPRVGKWLLLVAGYNIDSGCGGGGWLLWVDGEFAVNQPAAPWN